MNAGPVANLSRSSFLLCPSTVPIHDYRHMAGHAPRVQVIGNHLFYLDISTHMRTFKIQ
jgi:hypothetical protein